MIVIPELYKKHTGRDFFDDYYFNYPEPRPPVRLLKAETGLPANILDVVHTVSLEWGVWEYVEVQGDTADEVCGDNSFWIFFDENATVLSDLSGEGVPDEPLKEPYLSEMRAFVKQSFADKGSRLSALMAEREAQWEADVKALHDKNARHYALSRVTAAVAQEEAAESR